VIKPRMLEIISVGPKDYGGMEILRPQLLSDLTAMFLLKYLHRSHCRGKKANKSEMRNGLNRAEKLEASTQKGGIRCSKCG